ncbi:MAG: nucleotidyltransferase domain-containing protein, partial [Ilumatobacteraceae bacterium]
MGDGGTPITAEEVAKRWRPWTPDEVRERLAAVSATWGVAAGWALDLYVGEVSRPHEDIEITVPAGSFHAVAAALARFDWDVVGDGHLWPYPDALGRHRQTWLKDPGTGNY